MTQPISCYIRTLNEADRIATTVAAAFKVADEVIVVDSGSTDDTVAVAEGAGARVIAQPWLG
ncbi:MAG: glycosyltransferase, partial [Pseudomonadota bacterium]